MKIIIVKPLKFIDSLNLKVRNIQHEKIIADALTKDLIIEKLNVFIADYRKKGNEVIVGQKLEGDTVVSAQIKSKNKQSYFFPEPNPVHIFFNQAVEHLERSSEFKFQLKNIGKADYKALFTAFNIFFKEVSTGIIMLHASVEAFINQQIPDNFSIDIEGDTYTKKDIEWKDLKEKVKIFLPEITQVKFHVTNEKEYCQLTDIQKLRNDLIHLKTHYNNLLL